jgi:NAD(P)-dependent dehydrogenase (short-subunit alcohol dehydrogenase family)
MTRHRLLRNAADAALEVTVVPSFSRVGYAARRRVDGWDEPAAEALRGRVAVVTGASGGLGLAAATGLARAGARVWLIGRDKGRTDAAARRIRASVSGSWVDVATADLSSLAEVRDLAHAVMAATDRLDVLIHNAGTLVPDYQQTVDGVEVTAQTHLVAPFLLTSLLFPLLRSTPGSRVLTVSSGGMYTTGLDVDALDPDPNRFDGVAAYAQTKRAQVVLSQEWARRTAGSGVVFHAAHPGWADTPGLRSSLPRFHRLMGPLLRNSEQGADTIVWLAVSPHALDSNGRFWHDRRQRSTVRLPWTATRPGAADRLWQWCAAHAGVSPDPVGAR